MADDGSDDTRGTDGRFLPGNRFWEARSTAGPKPIFPKGDKGAEALWKACCEYFTWVEDNPLWEDKLVTFQGSATHEPTAKMRAMTVGGLCIFLDIDVTTWHDWKSTRPDLSHVIGRAENIIRAQKFAGAAADLLNANIIARDLGLSDKTELTGKDGRPIEFNDTRATGEVEEFVRELAAKHGISLNGAKANGKAKPNGNGAGRPH